MSNLENVVRETLCYKLFLDTGKKHIGEDAFVKLKNEIISEAWGKNPGHGFSGSMAWVVPKTSAIMRALEKAGIIIHWNDEYEVKFKQWYDSQPHPTGLGSLDYYSAKRQEFDAIYKKEKECWDSSSS